MKRTNEEILDKIQEIAHKESSLEVGMDRMLFYARKIDTQEFRKVYEKHLKLYGVMQGLRWVLGFIDDKNL